MSLPWKDDNVNLENNIEAARARLASLERRFQHDTELKQRYDDVLSELENQDIVEEVPVDEIDSDKNLVFYLPHHPVVRESRVST